MKFFEIVGKVFPVLEYPIVNTILLFVLIIIAILFAIFGIKKDKPTTKTSVLWLARAIVFVIFMAVCIGFGQIIYWVGRFGIWWGILAGIGYVVVLAVLFFAIAKHQQKKKQKQEQEVKENN